MMMFSKLHRVHKFHIVFLSDSIHFLGDVVVGTREMHVSMLLRTMAAALV